MTYSKKTETHIITAAILLFGISFLFSCKTINPSNTSASREVMVYTAKEAQRKVKSGRYKKVILSDGIYNDIELNLSKNLSNTTISAQTPGGVIFTGKSTINFSGDHNVLKDIIFFNIKGVDRVINIEDASNCRITNCAFIDCGTPFANQIVFEGGIITYLHSNSKNNRIDHCYWDGSFGICLAIGYQASYEPARTQPDRVNRNNSIDSCYVRNISEWGEINGKSLNGNDPFIIGWGHFPFAPNSNNIVQHNLFENISSDSEIISVKLSNTTIANNTFKDSPKTKYQSPQLSLRTGNNSIVKDNYFIHTGAGITVHGDGHHIFNNYIDSDYLGIHLPGGKRGEYSYPGQNNCTIEKNTIVDTQYPFMFGKGDWTIKPGNKKSNNIFNNIIYIDKTKLGDNYNKPIIFFDRKNNSAGRINWKNNTVFTNPTDLYTSSRYQKFLSQYNIASHKINSFDPKLELDENGLYKLRSDSRLILSGQGIQMKPKRTIIIKNTVDEGSKPQLSDLSLNNRPLTPSDVGPIWISDYKNFNMELVDYWKQWVVIDAQIDHNPAIITTPHIYTTTSILQFDLSKVEGIEIEYDNENNEYSISSTDNRPRIIEIPIEDFNENNIYNTIGNSAIARIQKRIVNKTKCANIITVTGNDEKIQFLNDRQAPMLLNTGFDTPIEVGNGKDIFLVKNKNYFVKLASETIYKLKDYKKNRKCRIEYTIKPVQ